MPNATSLCAGLSIGNIAGSFRRLNFQHIPLKFANRLKVIL